MNLDMSLDDMISSGRRGGKASSSRADKKSARSAPYGVGGMNRIAGGKTFAGSKTCNNCGARGHLAGQCPEAAQCHCCGGIDHLRIEPIPNLLTEVPYILNILPQLINHSHGLC